MTQTQKKISANDIRGMKGKGEAFVALTAYTSPIAQLANRHAEMVLVGDSVGMVLYGMPSTLPVTLDMMLAHGTCVARECTRALCVVDMPFGSYQSSPSQAFDNAARVLKETGASAIKLEGGAEMADTVRFLTERGVPVLGHIGLRPQQVQVMGGYRVQGKTDLQVQALHDDARCIADAGAFAMVVEGMLEDVARDITQKCPIPTIGIGASSACDGQILVTEDLLGLTAGAKAKFVKPYANLFEQAEAALQAFSGDVRARRFPGPENTYRKAS